MPKRINYMVSVFHVCIVLTVTPVLMAQQTGEPLVNKDYKDAPADVNVFTSSTYRQTVDLNGEWEYITGNNQKWKKTFVPGSLGFHKKLTFRKRFILPSYASRYHVQLKALGINYNCSITVNGIYIGSAVGAFSGFSMDLLDSALKPGKENIIEIDIDNSSERDRDSYLRPVPWGWARYSGIVREIYLQLLPKTAITQWKITYTFDGEYRNSSAVFTFLFQNFNRTGETAGAPSLRTEDIRDLGYYIEVYNVNSGKLVKSTAAEPRFISIHRAVQDTLRLEFRNIDLWSPNTPVLYRLKATLLQRNNVIIDTFQSTFGFRQVRIQKDGVVLNGRPLFLKGVNRIEQHPDYGVSLPWQQQEQDLILIKNLGANVIRAGPYPNHPYFYDLCDRLGLMVLEEIPVHGVPDRVISGRELTDSAKNILSKMINRDWRHPSVIGWGLGSMLDVTSKKTADYLDVLAESARALDTRPLFYSTAFQQDDICSDKVDFRLVDFFDPTVAELESIINNMSDADSENSLFIGRIGTHINSEAAGGGYVSSHSLEYQAKYTMDVYDASQKNRRVRGIFFWNFADWRGDVPALAVGAGSDNNLYRCGLVSEDREPRLAYQYLNGRLFGKTLTPPAMDSPPEKSQSSLIFTGFAIIIIMLAGLKKHRWFGQNFRRSLISPKIFFEDLIDSRNIQVWQTTMLCGAMSAAVAIGIAGMALFYKNSIYFDIVISQFISSPGLKNVVVFLIWHPVVNTAVISLVLLCGTGMLASLHYAAMRITGTNRGIFFSFNLLTWSGSHIIFLIIFTMPVYSVMQHSSALLFYTVLAAVAILLYFSRLILAMKVVYKNRFRTSLVNMVAVYGIFILVTCLFFQRQFQSFTYADMYLRTVFSHIN